MSMEGEQAISELLELKSWAEALMPVSKLWKEANNSTKIGTNRTLQK